jgi:hypothetical protein
MEDLVRQLLEFMTIELTVLLTAALPVIEVRGYMKLRRIC